jgi:hypothetical protein
MSIALLGESLCKALNIPIHRHPVLFKVKCGPLVVGKTSTVAVEALYTSVVHVDVTQEKGSIYHCDALQSFKAGIIPNCVGPVHMKLILVPRIPSAHLFDDAECDVPLGNASAAGPKLTIKRPWWMGVGKFGAIGWSAPTAKKFAYEIDDGETDKQSERRPIHEYLQKFDKPGKKILRFIAWDEHALTAAIRTIRVWKTYPKIRVENKIECARAGEGVSFAWRIENADEAWIEVLYENRREKVELTGTYVTRVEHYTREFVLVARGNGTMSRVRLKAVPFIGLAKQIGG